MDFDQKWEQVKPHVYNFLRSRLRPNEIEDALQIARIQVFLASQRWCPDKGASFITFCLNLINRRLRDIKRMRYPVSVPVYLIDSPHHPNTHFLQRNWLALEEENEDEVSLKETIPDSFSVEDTVIKKILIEDVYEAIDNCGLTERQKELLLLGKLEGNNYYLALKKIRNYLRSKGYNL